MATIRTPTGLRDKRITLQNPGKAVPDGQGGFLQTWTDCVPPAAWASIDPATGGPLEHITAGTLITVATHIVKMPYQDDVTTNSRIVFNGRFFNVIGGGSPSEDGIELELPCVEVKP